MLRTAGLVTFRNEGRTVYYSLAPTFSHPLLEYCVRDRFTASVTERHASLDCRLWHYDAVADTVVMGEFESGNLGRDLGAYLGIGTRQ